MQRYQKNAKEKRKNLTEDERINPVIYKNNLKTYLTTQFLRNDLSQSKLQQLNAISNKIDLIDLKQEKALEELKSCVTEVRKITSHHNDTGIWGVVKLTFLRNPKSYNDFNKIFYNKNQLKK